MTHIRRHLLLIAAAIMVLLTVGLKGASANKPFSMGYSGVQNIFEKSDLVTSPFIFSSLPQMPVSMVIMNAGGSDSVFQQLLQRFSNASPKEKILVVILIYLVLSIIVLFVSIILHRQYKARKRKLVEELKNEYQEQLANFLFDDQVEQVELRGINKKLNRQVFIDELMDLHSNLHGEVAEKLRDLYFNLGMHKDSLNKVYKGRWDAKAKGFKELSQMDVKDANQRIRQYVNSKNPILRMEAQVAMVKLSESDPLEFLDNLKFELSFWEQINIYDTLIYHQISIESFEKWLDNANPSVVIFSLRMITLFKHIHSAEKVRELLFHENPEISLAAVQALKSMEITEFAEDLKVLFQSETHKLKNILKSQRKNDKERDIKSLDDLLPRKIRLEIANAMQPIATASDVRFFEEIATDEENSFRLRIQAIKVLSSLQPEGETKLNEMLNSGNELVKKMIINVKQNQES